MSTEDELPQGMVRWHPEINLLAVRQLDHRKDPKYHKVGLTESKYESGWLMIGRGDFGEPNFTSDAYIANEARRAAAGETEFSTDDPDEDEHAVTPCQWGDKDLRTIDEFITVFDPRKP